MTVSTTTPVAGPVTPTDGALGRLRPLPGVVAAADGWLGAWQEVVSRRTLPHCLEQLEAAGTLDNLRRVVGEHDGPYRGPWFADSDVHKTLEALAWDLDRDPGRAAEARALVDLLARAQRPDGYLNSWFQTEKPDATLTELRDGHELYCLGHLAQAAVAWHRHGDDALLEITRRFADHVLDRLGDDPAGLCGHPEIETALVELYRATGEDAYLRLAARMLDRRGHGALAGGHFGPRYYQDHLPVRESAEATGHAVRQIYLATGMVDVAVETGDTALLAAAVRLWESAHEEKMYLTGGLGARHRDESFGDAHELPAERAYAETCAAIADVHWSRRLLLATGERRYADAVERALLNAVAAGVAADGTAFFYANPLQVRTAHAEDPGDEDSYTHRVPWFGCACCPPNLARLVASAQHYVAALDDDAVTLTLYASADLDVAGRPVRVRTGYPYDGAVLVETPEGLDGRALRLRVPEWCTSWRVAVDGADVAAEEVDGWVTVSPGSSLRLDLDMPARLVRPHPDVDAVRGCVAVARGPLVHALEQVDLPAGVRLEDVRVDPGAAAGTGPAVDGLDVPVTVRVTGHLAQDTGGGAPGTTVPFTLVPYARWGNRGAGAMRVWIPEATA